MNQRDSAKTITSTARSFFEAMDSSKTPATPKIRLFRMAVNWSIPLALFGGYLYFSGAPVAQIKAVPMHKPPSNNTKSE